MQIKQTKNRLICTNKNDETQKNLGTENAYIDENVAAHSSYLLNFERK